MRQGRPEPWNAVVGGEADATTVYRIGKESICHRGFTQAVWVEELLSSCKQAAWHGGQM